MTTETVIENFNALSESEKLLFAKEKRLELERLLGPYTLKEGIVVSCVISEHDSKPVERKVTSVVVDKDTEQIIVTFKPSIPTLAIRNCRVFSQRTRQQVIDWVLSVYPSMHIEWGTKYLPSDDQAVSLGFSYNKKDILKESDPVNLLIETQRIDFNMTVYSVSRLHSDKEEVFSQLSNAIKAACELAMKDDKPQWQTAL